MAEIIINPDGLVECHLVEEVEALVHSGLGTPTFERLTTVEWEDDHQEWVARLKATGEEICSGQIRAVVVREEALYVESLQWQKPRQ